MYLTSDDLAKDGGRSRLVLVGSKGRVKKWGIFP